MALKRSIKIWQRLNYILYAFIAFFTFFILLSKISFQSGFRLLTVETGSMRPTIKKGSLIFIKEDSDYKIGEIITFKSPENPKKKITHRIVEKKEEKEEVLFTTKGDANKDVDSTEVSKSAILGKVIFTVPLLGYVFSFSKTLPGLIIFIIIPALIIIYDEVFKIHREWLNLKKREVASKE